MELRTMGLVTGYDNDVFISYSHIDNQPFGDPGGGWVDIFHENLQNFVSVHVGQRVDIWRDRRLSGAEVFSEEIEEQLRSSAVLVSVVSPGYVRSVWCNRELLGFTRTAKDHGDLRVGNLQRVVKVLRLPVDRGSPDSLLDEVLGVQFYRIDAKSGRPRDLLIDPSDDARQVFRARVDDVAQDLSRLLAAMAAPHRSEMPSPQPTVAGTVFLAWTTADLTEHREKLRRELEARNYRVVPSGTPPLEAACVRASVLAALGEAQVAIHLIGALYGYVPEGEQRSVIDLQSDDSVYQASNSAAARIIWIAPNAEAHDPRMAALVDRLQQQSPQAGRVDLLANQTIEDLKALVLDRLKPVSATPDRPMKASTSEVYLMCDQLDRANVEPIQNFLFDQSLEVRLPLFDGDSDVIRREHYETLRECDGALIFWGNAKEGWLRNMVRDLNKVFGLGRINPFKAKAIYLSDLPDANKESFRTLELPIIRPNPRFEPSLLRPFVGQLSAD
jgi:hypothetical protein